jgi:hypothetical protein
MSLRSPTEDEKAAFVMPAWIAGIQVCMDASGDVHVDLDSSPPCWNDGIGGLFFNRAKLIYSFFKGEITKDTKKEFSRKACPGLRSGGAKTPSQT